MSVGDIGLPPQVGLDDVEWEDEARTSSLGQRRVIGEIRRDRAYLDTVEEIWQGLRQFVD